MKEGQRLWSREELILAINLYCKLPFGRIHHRNPEIVALAELIGRTPSSVAFKLSNFASLDPSLQQRGIKGASNSSKLDKAIWQEFYENWDKLPFESEVLLSKKSSTPLPESDEDEEEYVPGKGLTKEARVQARVNQSFFRRMVMAAYNSQCCITGITQEELLVAGHIKPWAEDTANRLNPRNGIAINGLHDKAFESGLITITPDYKVKVSSILKKQHKDKAIEEYFLRYDNQPIILPSRFRPDPVFLEYHSTIRFKP
jgi:putative restriction endonuclease